MLSLELISVLKTALILWSQALLSISKLHSTISLLDKVNISSYGISVFLIFSSLYLRFIGTLNSPEIFISL